MGKRRKFKRDDTVKNLISAMQKADETERMSGRSSSKTSKYSADNLRRRNIRRHRELQLIQHEFDAILAPEHALMDLISQEGLLPSRREHRTASARERRRNYLYNIGDDLMDRRSEIERDIFDDDDIFDEVTSIYRP